jgi:hypothetical protein
MNSSRRIYWMAHFPSSLRLANTPAVDEDRRRDIGANWLGVQRLAWAAPRNLGQSDQRERLVTLFTRSNDVEVSISQEFDKESAWQM